MYSLLIKNGMLVDGISPKRRKADIAVENGRIAAIGVCGDEEAVSIVDAGGCLVTPGLIDHHAHLYPMAPAGIPAEAVCFASGVTSAVDAGSTGCDSFERYRPFMEQSKLGIQAYLNVCSTGLASLPEPENLDPEAFDRSRIRELFEQYPGELLGLKIRISRSIVGGAGLKPLQAASELAEELAVPLMVHSTDPPENFKILLSLLKPGDIVTHMYHNTGFTILDEEKRVQDAVWQARERGILFEAADARAHFSFEVSEVAMREAFLPDFIATDLTAFSMHLRPTSFNLAMQISKYCALGMSFEAVIRRCSANPAKNMGIFETAGSLETGKTADIAVFKPIRQKTRFGDRVYGDPSEEFREGTILYQPVLTVKTGEMVYRDITF